MKTTRLLALALVTLLGGLHQSAAAVTIYNYTGNQFTLVEPENGLEYAAHITATATFNRVPLAGAIRPAPRYSLTLIREGGRDVTVTGRRASDLVDDLNIFWFGEDGDISEWLLQGSRFHLDGVTKLFTLNQNGASDGAGLGQLRGTGENEDNPGEWVVAPIPPGDSVVAPIPLPASLPLAAVGVALLFGLSRRGALRRG